jgi:hypothetical protein
VRRGQVIGGKNIRCYAGVITSYETKEGCLVIGMGIKEMRETNSSQKMRSSSREEV